MAELDDVLKEISDITEAARNGSLVDKDALIQAMTGQIEQVVAAQVQAKLDSAPRRRVEGLRIGEGGDSIGKANRYYRMAKSFAADGKHKDMGGVYTPADLMLAKLVIDYGHKVQPDRVKAPSTDLEQVIKFLDPGQAGAGAEYTPQDLMPALWNDFYMASRIAGAVTTVPMTSDPMDIPRGFGAPTWRKGASGVPVSTPDMATGDDQLKSTELVATQEWSYLMDEDAVVALMPAMRAELARSGAEIIDAFAINADATEAATGNINRDDGLPSADSYFLSNGADGIRHFHLVDNTGQTVDAGGALTDAKVTEMLGKLGKYATDVSGLIFTCDIGTYLNGWLSTATGAPGNFVITLDKFGPQAVVFTGQMAAYRGIPIIPSPVYLPSEADGKQSATAASNTKGGVSVFHRAMWRLGFRRDLLIEMDRDIQSRKYVLVASIRQAVTARGPRSSAFHTAGLRNITI
jgi:HK97 family phage major capsid protein